MGCLEPAASELGPLLWKGCLLVARHPGGVHRHAAHTLVVAVLDPVAVHTPRYAWSRPLWYQVGLDLQPWGCQPNSPDGCRSSLGRPGYWMGLGGNRIYPVAGVTLTTTMMLVISRVMLHRRHAQVTKGQGSQK